MKERKTKMRKQRMLTSEQKIKDQRKKQDKLRNLRRKLKKGEF